MTDYLEKFVTKQIEHYIPDGIDPYSHIHMRAFMYDIIGELVENRNIPPKLESIKYLCMNYKKVIYQKLSVLN